MHKTQLVPMYKTAPINTRESLLLCHMDLAPLPVQEWGADFVSALIRQGMMRASTQRQPAVNVDQKGESHVVA